MSHDLLDWIRTELQSQPAALAPDVPAQQRGQAERAVGVGVAVVADPEVAQIEQPDGGGCGPGERTVLRAISVRPTRKGVGPATTFRPPAMGCG